MLKSDLAAHVANAHSLSKAEAARILDTITHTIVQTVKKGGKVALTGFGCFRQVHRSSRAGVNPTTGVKIQVTARSAPKFTPSAAFKEAIHPKTTKRSRRRAEVSS